MTSKLTAAVPLAATKRTPSDPVALSGTVTPVARASPAGKLSVLVLAVFATPGVRARKPPDVECETLSTPVTAVAVEGTFLVASLGN